MGVVEQSLVAAGATVSGGHVRRSIIGPRAEIHNGSEVEECVLMGGVHVGKNVRLRRCIVPESTHIPDGTDLGHDPEQDRRTFKITPGGVLVIPEHPPLPQNGGQRSR